MMKITSKSYHRYCPLALWITSNNFPAILSTHPTVSALHFSHPPPQQRNFGSTTPLLEGLSYSSPLRSEVFHQESYHSRFTRRERRYSSSKWMSTTSDDAMATQEHAQQLRVALCQFQVTEDKTVNLQTCSSFIDKAVSSSATTTTSKIDLVVLPEIWNSPYATAAFSEYAEPVPNVVDDDGKSAIFTKEDSPSVHLLKQKAIQHQIYIVGGSIPEVDHDNQLYNTCIVVNPQGQIIAKHRKVHLFDINVPNGITFRESDTLSSGSQITSFTTPWCNIGVGICYDIRFPEYAMLLGQTCQILIYPGAFNLVTGPAHWELLQRARAVDTQCYVLTASPARSVVTADDNTRPKSSNKYPPYSAWGHSTVVAPWGDIIATTDEKESIVVADIDLTKVSSMRQSIPVRNQKRTDLYTLEKKD